MALYILIVLLCVCLIELHSIHASLRMVLGVLHNIHEGIESLVEESDKGNSRTTPHNERTE